MRTNEDLTELTLDDSTLYMVNDLIFTNAGELMNVVVEETEDTEWEHGDNIEW